MTEVVTKRFMLSVISGSDGFLLDLRTPG